MFQRPQIALLLSTAFVAGLLIWLVVSIYRINDGHWAYPLDDTYIHLAIAKHQALGQGWSVSGEGFSHSSSAPLFTAVLALLFPLVGNSLLLPVFVNIPAAFLVLLVLYKLARLFDLETYGTLAFLATACLVLPLAPLVVLGMEHVWHIAWCLVFYFSFAKYLSGKGSYLALFFLGIIGPAIRYESLFLIAAVVLMLLLKSRWRHAIPLAIAAWVLPLWYGYIAMQQGWGFLPNSLWLKSSAGQLSDSWQLMKSFMMVFIKLATTPELVTLLAVLLFGYVFVAVRRDGIHSLVAVPITTLILHMQLASTGSFMRYEAYLVGLLLCACVVVLRDWSYDRRSVSWQESVPVTLLLLLVLSPLLVRGVKSHTHTSKAANNIYSQQVQMANFVQQHYPDSAVAVNDIGAVCYYNSIRLTDLAGLADNSVAKAYAGGAIEGEKKFQILAEERNLSLIMLYESWYYGNIPVEWRKVAELRIKDNYICGDDVVAFYAPTQGTAAVLTQRLQEWAPRLQGKNQLLLLRQD